MNIYPYGKHKIFKNDVKIIKNVLESNFITQGPLVKIFEKKIAKYVNANFSVATNSATSALHIACLSLGLKPNDELWTVPNSFVASANCGLYCGAKVDFVDINKNHFNIDIDKLEKKLKKKKPKILVSVHLGGSPPEQEKIWALAKKYKFYVIEDASHAFGATRKKIKVGSCVWSDITIFSFHPVKMITTGEGGVAVTNKKKYYEKMQMLANHGITRDKNRLKKKKLGFWHYEQQMLGFNYRMNEISAGLGLSQLKKINLFLKKRNELAKNYKILIKNLPVRHQDIIKHNKSSYHLFVILLNLKKIKKKYNQVFNELRKKGLLVNLHYSPIHLQPFYKNLGFKTGDFPIAENYAKQAISLPLYYDLNKKDQKKIISILTKIIE